jgi:peptidyl-prolyl cis-trans isomerase A (cyclophilin A)
MKTTSLAIVFLALLGVAPAAPALRIHTELGLIEVELDSAHAPATVANFLKYVEAGRYTGGQFHRTVTLHPDNQPNNTVKIEVIQGGVNPEFAEKDWPPLALERTNVTGLKHLDGTISMARGGPDTATSDFFICVGDQPELDFGGKRNPDGQGFAAFGRVTKGLDIVRKIQASAAEGQKLTPPVHIEKIERLP